MAGRASDRIAEEQAALRRVATLVARAAPAEEVFAAVTAEVGRLLAVDITVLARYDPDDAITVVGTWPSTWPSTGAAAPTPVGSRLPVGGRNVTTRVVRTGRPARMDYADASGAGASGPIWTSATRVWGLRSSVGAPIRVEGRLWGVIVVGSTSEAILPTDTEARLAGFAELVATAVANVAARVELRGFAEEQAALRRVATLVARAALAEEVFAAVTAEVGRVLAVDVAVLNRYDPDGTQTVLGTWSRTGAVPVAVGHRTPLGGRNVSTLVFRTGRPARIDDYAGAFGAAADLARESGFRSMVGVPIGVEGRLWGVIIVGSTSQTLPSPDTEDRLAGFTELVATAIANAQARTELRVFAEEQAALRRVATLVARAAPPAEVFAAVTAEVGRVLNVDFSAMGRYDADGAATVLGIWTRTGAPVPVPVDRVGLGGANVTTQVFETGRPARLDNYAGAFGAAADVGRGWGIRSMVGVPISVEDRLWGCVITASSREEPLPADTEARLSGFTELVATAIANAEAQAALTTSRARIVAAADTTRRHIERDLHDGAQQRLVSVALQLRTMQASPPEAGGLTAQLNDAADGLTGVLDELREIARGLHPAALAAGGLPPALKALARRSAIPVRLEIGIDRRLPEPIELAAYYVVAEALTNAAKHSAATVVDVHVQDGGGALHVRVQDDGRGGADLTRGTGLVGLTDRVEALGGRLALHSPPGAGTTMRMDLPLTAPAAPGSPAADTGRPECADRHRAAEPEASGPA
jgi:GAF domain-containing protein